MSEYVPCVFVLFQQKDFMQFMLDLRLQKFRLLSKIFSFYNRKTSYKYEIIFLLCKTKILQYKKLYRKVR